MSIKNIVMLGTGAVGKSAITIQFVSHYFSFQYNPTIEDSFRSHVELDGNVHVISILDTAGQEEYSSLRDSYIRSGDGYVIVYSITSKASFIEANGIREEIYRVLDKDFSEHLPIILVGNKCDLEHDRDVPKDEVKEICEAWNVKHLECSAKEKINIDAIYETILREVLDYENAPSDESTSNDDSNNEQAKDRKKSKKHRRGLKKLGCTIV